MNLVVHFEIHATEPQRLIDFYGQLLGWGFTQFGDAPYWSIDTGEGSRQRPDEPGFGINGGLTQRVGPRPEPGAPVQGANVVVAVDDVDAYWSRALELGAQEASPPQSLEGVGRIGYLLDPDHNLFGMITPDM